MRAYYGSRFSANQTTTPEGFLICHNVPVARTGWQDYLGEEIGVPEMTGKVVKVFRSPEEVFSPAAIASFEGKLLTSEHPSELVTPQNATRYAKGVVTNVRQGGSGDSGDSDLLLADLVVHDQQLIDDIQAGKREVSCGYDCTYAAADDGTYQQQQIRGNHVAVVTNGRAGDRVAIKDSKSEKPKGVKYMSKYLGKTGKNSPVTTMLVALGLKQMATDAEPEEIMDAMNAIAAENGGEPAKEEPAKDEDPIQTLSAQVAQLTALVTKLAQGGGDPAPDPLDAAIAELEKPAADNEEESHTIPAEHMDEAGPVSSPEDRPKSALTGDNAHKLATLRALKPILAAMKDPAERKLVVDAALASFATKPANPAAYAAINNGQKKPTGDGKPAAAADPAELGRKIARDHNPHYKVRA